MASRIDRLRREYHDADRRRSFAADVIADIVTTGGILDADRTARYRTLVATTDAAYAAYAEARS